MWRRPYLGNDPAKATVNRQTLGVAWLSWAHVWLQNMAQVQFGERALTGAISAAATVASSTSVRSGGKGSTMVGFTMVLTRAGSQCGAGHSNTNTHNAGTVRCAMATGGGQAGSYLYKYMSDVLLDSLP